MTQERYIRQTTLPFVGDSGQEKLKNSHIIVVGCGGLGCPLLLYLAAAGIGKITIIDHDTVSLSNLHRQILFDDKDIGVFKAEIAAKKLMQSYPDTKITAVTQRLDTDLAHKICTHADLVIDGTDRFLSKYILSEICPKLLTASVAGISGYIAGFTPHIPYRTIFPSLPEQAPNCAENGVLGPFAGLMGNFLATEAIKLIVNHPNTILHTLIKIDSQNLHFSKSNFAMHQNNNNFKFPKINYIRLSDNLEGTLIDLREKDELANNPLIKNALSKPLSLLDLSEISKISNLILKCHSGRRAEKVALQLALSEHRTDNIKIAI